MIHKKNNKIYKVQDIEMNDNKKDMDMPTNDDSGKLELLPFSE